MTGAAAVAEAVIRIHPFDITAGMEALYTALHMDATARRTMAEALRRIDDFFDRLAPVQAAPRA